MRRSILSGGHLPESLADFDQLARAGTLRHRVCVECGQDFTPRTVQTPLGWAETQISGLCETCFDALFKDEDESDLDDQAF